MEIDSKITDPETLRKLEEESRFIEQLMGLETPVNNDSYSAEEEIEDSNEDVEDIILSEKIEVLTNEDLVLNRDGEYVQYHEDMVFIIHRKYFVEEAEVIYLDFQGIDEDEQKVIIALDHKKNEIKISNDYKGLLCVFNTVDNGFIFFLNEECAIEAGCEYINGVWKFQEKKEILSNITDYNKLPFYKDLEESINKFFPNNWWFQKIDYTFDPKIPERKYFVEDNINHGFIYSLVIKFPFIKITNSVNAEHNIEDLYVVVLFKETGESRSVIYGFLF